MNSHIDNSLKIIKWNGGFSPFILLFPAFVSLVYSYNYHQFWIVYDLVAIFLFLHYLASDKKRLTNTQYVFLLIVLLYFFILVLISNHWLLGFLSVWDTFKHLIYIPIIASVSGLGATMKYRKPSRALYLLVVFSFFVQMFVVGIQYLTTSNVENLSRAYFDNFSGTFGDGGSHAIGYISLLAVTATLAYRKKWIYVISILILASIVNLISENAGFFVLLGLVLLSFIFLMKIDLKLIPIAIISSFLVFFILSFSLYTEISYGKIIISRLFSVFEIPDHYDISEGYGRSTYLYLASYLGGWFGRGPGAYSSIYLMEAYDYANIIDPRLNISEASHLIAESGYIGLFLTLLLYIQFIANIFKKLVTKFMMIIIFIASFFYTALLMNESHFFILLITFYFYKIAENCSDYELGWSKRE